jgi:hypothetical protein
MGIRRKCTVVVHPSKVQLSFKCLGFSCPSAVFLHFGSFIVVIATNKYFGIIRLPDFCVSGEHAQLQRHVPANNIIASLEVVASVSILSSLFSILIISIITIIKVAHPIFSSVILESKSVRHVAAGLLRHQRSEEELL